MKLQILFRSAAILLLTFFIHGCSSLGEPARPVVIATYTPVPITLDGKLDDIAWNRTPSYELVHSGGQFDFKPEKSLREFRKGVVEPGYVKVLWDERYLYIGFDLVDRDLEDHATSHQALLYQLADTAEVFLKPMNQTWYWEFYVTPNKYTASFFFPGRGLKGLATIFSKTPAVKGIRRSAFCKGTLNNCWDQDKRWTVELAIPRAEIGMQGEKLDPEVPWLIFFARYNFGRYLPWKETTAFPYQAKFDYHIHEDYARLKMVK